MPEKPKSLRTSRLASATHPLHIAPSEIFTFRAVPALYPSSATIPPAPFARQTLSPHSKMGSTSDISLRWSRHCLRDRPNVVLVMSCSHPANVPSRFSHRSRLQNKFSRAPTFCGVINGFAQSQCRTPLQRAFHQRRSLPQNGPSYCNAISRSAPGISEDVFQNVR